LDDLKAKLNNVTMATCDLNEQRMNDLITEKLNAMSIGKRKQSNDSSSGNESENFGSEPNSSSGYDSGPTTARKPSMGCSFNFRNAQLQVQQQAAATASTYTPSTDSESEIVQPVPRKKLPAGAVAMPHMIQL
jgi:hypothetical protein